MRTKDLSEYTVIIGANFLNIQGVSKMLSIKPFVPVLTEHSRYFHPKTCNLHLFWSDGLCTFQGSLPDFGFITEFDLNNNSLCKENLKNKSGTCSSPVFRTCWKVR